MSVRWIRFSQEYVFRFLNSSFSLPSSFFGDYLNGVPESPESLIFDIYVSIFALRELWKMQQINEFFRSIRSDNKGKVLLQKEITSSLHRTLFRSLLHYILSYLMQEIIFFFYDISYTSISAHLHTLWPANPSSMHRWKYNTGKIWMKNSYNCIRSKGKLISCYLRNTN